MSKVQSLICNGMWDYPDANGEREIYEPLARELESEKRLLDEQRAGHAPVRVAADTHVLDVAAHWMEIRSGREDVLHK